MTRFRLPIRSSDMPSFRLDRSIETIPSIAHCRSIVLTHSIKSRLAAFGYVPLASLHPRAPEFCSIRLVALRHLRPKTVCARW